MGIHVHREKSASLTDTLLARPYKLVASMRHRGSKRDTAHNGIEIELASNPLDPEALGGTYEH
jgi:hypothetical protein